MNKNIKFNQKLLLKAYEEYESIQFGIKQDLSKTELSLDYQKGTWREIYIKAHLRRFERAFFHLAEIKKRIKKSKIRILDIGSYNVYHPEINKIFPGSVFRYTDDSHDIEKHALTEDKDNSYDLVLLWEVIEHFYKDPMFALNEINRVLKPGGLLFITTPNLVSWDAVLRSLLGKSPLNYPKYGMASNFRRHVHEHVPNSIKEILYFAGFKRTVWTENVYTHDYGNLAMRYFKEIGISLKDRGDTIFAVASKHSSYVERHPAFLYDLWNGSDEMVAKIQKKKRGK